LGNGPAGDALIEISVMPHPFFHRDGVNVTVEVPVTLTEAVEGAKITVPTVDGPVSMTVPAGSTSAPSSGCADAGSRPRRVREAISTSR